MSVIDVDCHVIETEVTWSYMQGDDAAVRPRVLAQTDSESSTNRNSEFWFFDSMMSNKRAFPPERSRTPADSAEMRNLDMRSKHMDELGTDIQVLYPTVLLGMAMGARTHTQVAMCRAYNRWLADVYRNGEDRFRWLVVPPILDRDASMEELEFGKANGACGVMLHGLMGDYTPVDPYLFPLYQKANDLELPICFHAGMYNHAFEGIFHSRLTGLWKAKVPVISAFHAMALSDIPERYPRVRWGFIEGRGFVGALRTDRPRRPPQADAGQGDPARPHAPKAVLRRLSDRGRHPLHPQVRRRGAPRHRLRLRPRGHF